MSTTDGDPELTFKIYTDLLGVAVNKCTKIASLIHFDKSHKLHVGLITLHGSILELSHSIYILIKNDSPTGIPILLRSLLEATVDFRNLSNDKSYGYYLDAADLDQWISVLREAKEQSNPYLADIAKVPDLETILDNNVKALNELKQKGYSPLKHYKKFEISDMSSEYKSFYNFLCCEAHNNLRALHSRHAKLSADFKDYEMEFFSSIDADAHLPYIDSTLGILLSTTESIHQTFDTGHATDIAQLQNLLKCIRAPWLA